MSDHEDAMQSERVPVVVFPFAVDYPFAHLSRLFAVDPERARLELRGEQMIAVFGPWRVSTELTNVDSITITGPYSAIKVAGPPRLSLADGGITFATNPLAGLCIRFREAVSGLFPMSLLRHGSLTVTVDEPERVKEVLERSIRALTEVPDETAAVERLVQGEHDTIQALTSAELRERAATLGIENANALSHSELVDLMESWQT